MKAKLIERQRRRNDAISYSEVHKIKEFDKHFWNISKILIFFLFLSLFVFLITAVTSGTTETANLAQCNSKADFVVSCQKSVSMLWFSINFLKFFLKPSEVINMHKSSYLGKRVLTNSLNKN